MTSSIKQLLALGPIPADSEMSDELFEKYDKLLNFSQPLSYDDAALLRSRADISGTQEE